MVFSTKTSEEITHGGKIIMPPSALEKLSRLNISYPMLFKLSSGNSDSCTHCGVLEFVAEEGRIYVPHWVSLSPSPSLPPSFSLSLSLSLSFFNNINNLRVCTPEEVPKTCVSIVWHGTLIMPPGAELVG